MPSNEELKAFLTLEQLRQVRDIAAKCGCICHYADAMHMFACCDATYFRVDLYDAEQTFAPIQGVNDPPYSSRLSSNELGREINPLEGDSELV